MNTLGRSITCKFFKSTEDYARMKRAWSWAMQTRTKLDAPHHALYLILCGKNWVKAFSQPKRFAHPAELAIIRARYPINASPPKQCGVNGHAHGRRPPYDFFDEFLSADAENRINDLLPKVMDMQRATLEGKSIEPYTLPAEVTRNG